MARMAYDELIARLTLQQANIATYATDVGATAEEIADITNDLANLEYAGDYAEVVDGNKKTVIQIKQALLDGDPKATIPDYPAFTAGTLPQPAKPGALQRYFDRGKRWKTAPGYTAEIGTALSYNGTTPKPDPNTVKPEIEVFASASNYLFSVVVSNRGEASMWDIYILRKNGTWTKTDSATGKSADVNIAPSAIGDPEQIQVRVQLRKGNEDYGIVSDPVYVTVNP